MSSGIEVDGFDDLENMLQDMTLTDEDQKKAMKAALIPAYEATQEDTPVRTDILKKSEKMQVKKEDFAVVGVIKYGAFWDIFNEFGTSKDKSHVGFFEKAINRSTDKVVEILAQELLSKIK